MISKELILPLVLIYSQTVFSPSPLLKAPWFAARWPLLVLSTTKRAMATLYYLIIVPRCLLVITPTRAEQIGGKLCRCIRFFALAQNDKFNLPNTCGDNNRSQAENKLSVKKYIVIIIYIFTSIKLTQTLSWLIL
jgi:hypothetical protein